MSETQFLGYLVIALGTLIGLFVVVGKPIMRAVEIMTKLNLNIEALKGDVTGVKNDVKDQVEHAREGRRKLWEAHNELKDQVGEHENRISKLETTVKIHHGDMR